MCSLQVGRAQASSCLWLFAFARASSRSKCGRQLEGCSTHSAPPPHMLPWALAKDLIVAVLQLLLILRC